jgi:hypothetical protein
VRGRLELWVIRHVGRWRRLEAVEIAALEEVDRFDHLRLLEPIGNVPPAEAEMTSYADLETRAAAVGLKATSLLETRRGSVGVLQAGIGFPCAEG